jgi:hypothetical protein
MKLTKLALAASLAIGLASANAATVNIANTNFAFDGSELLFLDNVGQPLAEGFIALSTTPNIGGMIAGGITVLNGGNYPGGGIFGGAISVANPDPGPLNGVNLFLVIGNNADPNLADQFGVIDIGQSFSKADTPPPASSIDFSAGPGSTIVEGTLGPAAGLDLSGFGGPANYTGNALLLVPEPSSGLLFGIAGLALFIRRKR